MATPLIIAIFSFLENIISFGLKMVPASPERECNKYLSRPKPMIINEIAIIKVGFE